MVVTHGVRSSASDVRMRVTPQRQPPVVPHKAVFSEVSKIGKETAVVTGCTPGCGVGVVEVVV